MEFWGVEVKSGAPVRVYPGVGKVLHLSQACVGEQKKEKSDESVYLSVNVNGAKLVLGTLFTHRLPQQQFDLVFDKEFEISHSWKNGSVYFYGYRADNMSDDNESSEEEYDESDSEKDIPNTVASNGKPVPKPKQQKHEETGKATASKVKDSEAAKELPKKNFNSKEGDESSDSEEGDKSSDSEEGDEISDDDLMSQDDDEDDDEESSESDEETPKKEAVPSKKRPAEAATKTPVQEKKAKLSPQKTDSKKTSVHVATPHPAKQAGKKTPGGKPDQGTQKSGGAHSCNSCNRNFGTEKALESHNKAKHSAGK